MSRDLIKLSLIHLCVVEPVRVGQLESSLMTSCKSSTAPPYINMRRSLIRTKTPVGVFLFLTIHLSAWNQIFFMPHHTHRWRHTFFLFFYLTKSDSECRGAPVTIPFVNTKLPHVAEMNMVHVDENHTLYRMFLGSHSGSVILVLGLLGFLWRIRRGMLSDI